MIEHIGGAEDSMGVVERIIRFSLKIFCLVFSRYMEISYPWLCHIISQVDFADVINHLKVESFYQLIEGKL